MESNHILINVIYMLINIWKEKKGKENNVMLSNNLS